ncbi:MAG: hypothetical protein ABJK37_00565, partial [Paraglaciecola sp.]|uniref:hypothetical protein n=1 Tax=Paraglaciecola sp. TaxID=1920173 RepID=UPI0032986D27
TFIVFGDQFYRQTKIITENTMNVRQLLSKYLVNVTPNMHKTRRLSLFTHFLMVTAVWGGFGKH